MSLPPKDHSHDEFSRASSTAISAPEFDAEARRLLLAVAHEAINSAFDHREVDLTPPLPQLAQPRGAFTTLYLHSSLRGCVGHIVPAFSLYRTVAETARAAAFEDTRFTPVRREEAPELEVSLSILSPLFEIRPDQVEIGLYGLVVSQGNHRGLLLPQVATEHGWDRLTFLEQTCRKAGLPTDAWKLGARIQAFTAEVFSDRCL
ncbi:MAG: AmmeMemoRadiSam system protein A [Terriglobales bacterium]|jgi:AmmeMemoRadiSam system protein A